MAGTARRGSAPVIAPAPRRAVARTGRSVGTTHARSASGPLTGPAQSNPPGLATTRMAARPSSCLQRRTAAPFLSSELRSVYADARRHWNGAEVEFAVGWRPRAQPGENDCARAIFRVVAKSRRLHLDPHRTPRVDSRTVMNDRDCLTGRSAGHQTQKTQAVESASNRRLPTANDSYG